MRQAEKKNKSTSVILTLAIHALLFVLFLFFGFTAPDPPIEEEGSPLTIRLGLTEVGSGNTFDNPAPNPQPVVKPTQPVVAQEILTDNSTPQIKAPTNKVKQKQEPKKPTQEELDRIKREQEEAIIKKHYEQMWAKNSSKNTDAGKESGGGNSSKPGTQGRSDGTKNGGNIGGSLPGGGSYKLRGRAIESIPKINDSSQDEGKVVVDIRVNRAGKVIRAIPGGRGSTTNSSILFKKAQEAAYDAKFSANPDSPEEQVGSMTFIFVLGR